MAYTHKGDLFTCNGILVKGKLLVNEQGNIKTQSLNVKNSKIRENLDVCGILNTDTIKPKSSSFVNFPYKINIATSSGLCVNGTKVVGIQQSGINYPDSSDLSDVASKTNQIIDVLRSHGLIEHSYI